MAPTKQMVDHAMKGLAYFDTFSELYDWTEESVDDLQRSNTPFLKRPLQPEPSNALPSSNVLLMHDYRNGYIESGYEGSQGAFISHEEYALEYWQRVEVFDYFAHYRVSIPPSSWVNAGHRNGTLVLGTFSLEGQKDHEIKATHCERMLVQEGSRYWVADKLARMASHYGFDGYLLNIETGNLNVGADVWRNGKALAEFLTQLQQDLAQLPSGGKLIWYDALTIDQVNGYQNKLNNQNAKFAQAAGSVITNYWWNAESLEETAKFASQYGPKPAQVYSGVDCWAQTQDGPDPNTRETYGIDDVDGTGASGASGTGPGHGGTATGLAVRENASLGLGSGIFASGWAFEHFARGKNVDRFMWEGKLEVKNSKLDPKPFALDLKAWKDLDVECACYTGTQQHIRRDLELNPVGKYAKRYPAGSGSFFYTDYREAFLHQGGGNFQAHLGAQSILPAPGDRTAPLNSLPEQHEVGKLVANFRIGPDRRSKCSLEISIPTAPAIGANSEFQAFIPLHEIYPRRDLDLDFTISYKKPPNLPGLVLYLEIVRGTSPQWVQLVEGSGKPRLPLVKNQEQVTGLGIWLKGPAKDILEQISKDNLCTLAVLDILEITVKPTGLTYPPSAINDGKFVPYGTGEVAHERLVWSIPFSTAPSDLLPFSMITRSFSHFVISANGQEVGRAYGLMFVVADKYFEYWKEEKNLDGTKRTTVDIKIEGFAFDGSLIATFTGQYSLAAHAKL